MGRRRFAKKGEERMESSEIGAAQDVRHFKLVARPGADEEEQPLILEPYAPPGNLTFM